MGTLDSLYRYRGRDLLLANFLVCIYTAQVDARAWPLELYRDVTAVGIQMSETDGTWQFSGWEATVKQVTRINSPKKGKVWTILSCHFSAQHKRICYFTGPGEMKSDDEMRQPDTGESQYTYSIKIRYCSASYLQSYKEKERGVVDLGQKKRN
jgi:hypothetical protein